MSTPITLTGAYTCTHHNDKQRTECPVCLVTQLRAELKDARRAINEQSTLRLTAEGSLAHLREWQAGVIANAKLHHAERKDAIARAERAEAALADAKEECKNVRLKWHAVMGTCAAKEDAILEADEELVCLRARAERAEADAAAYLKRAESFRKISDEAEAELATERSRLDWLLEDNVTRFENSCFDRADIDAGMKEGA